MRVLLVLCVAWLTSGCGITKEQFFGGDDYQCKSYGAEPGSPQYFDCRMALNQQAANAAAQRRAVAASDPGPVFTPSIMSLPRSAPEIRCESRPTGLGGSETVCR